jgi:CheY-like chemotaxis protein
MSHELRTPLTAILGWTRILKGNALPEDKRRLAIATIDRNAAMEARLVEEILDASRIISGKLRLDFGPVDTAEILKSVVQSMRPAAEAADLQILEELPAVPSIRGNASRLEQVFGNLLSNAIKFTPPGGKISVLLTQAESRVEVRVTDTGEGITREFIPHIFERFRQADSSLTRKHGGLGLGLAIARHIVGLHGGTVAVESPGPGQGSTFLVSIPISDAGSRATDLRCAVKEVSSSALAGIQALIVEDDEDSRLLLAEALEQYGAQVRSAESCQSALRLLEDREDRDVEIDVFLFDIGMPECDGYSLMAKVRSMRKYRQTPAIAVTSFATDNDQEMAFSAGFQGHVAKPFDPCALVSQVAELVNTWPPEAVA